MGIGLIMAGLGQGIAQGGQTFGNAAIKSYEDERRDALETRREAALLNRQEALISARSAQEKKDAEELAQSNAKQSQAVVERAAEKPIERAAGQVLQRGAAAGASVEGMQSPEDLKAYMKEHPEYRKQLESSGIIAKETRLSKAEDEAKTALEMGTHSQVQKSFEAARSATLAEIKAENSKARDEQRHQETMQGLGIRQQVADTGKARADNAGAGGAKGVASSKISENGTILTIMRDGTVVDTGVKVDTRVSRANMDTKLSKENMDYRNSSPDEKKAVLDGIFNPAKTSTPSGVAKPQTQNDFDKLPSGTRYTDPNGVTRIKR